MKKAQWSPINSETTGAGISPPANNQRPGLARLPINFSNNFPNGTPVRAKEHYPEPPKHSLERPRFVTNLTSSSDVTAADAGSRAPKPRDVGSAKNVNTVKSKASTPINIISPDERSSERQKRHEMEPNGRHNATVPSSKTGSQTPKANREPRVPAMTKPTQPQEPASPQDLREVYRAFNLPSPSHDPAARERPSNAARTSEPRQGSVKRTPGQRDTPAGSTKDSTHEQSAKPHQSQPMPVPNGQPMEIDEQSSSASDVNAPNLPTEAERKAEVAVEETESALVDELADVVTATSLPDDHPIEWLAEARDVFQRSLPPFVTKQKLGVRRMVELPLVEGQKDPGQVEVVYRFWDAFHTFASIDIKGQRFIVKVFRGGATPYRPWLGPQAGFSDTALAYSKQGLRGSKTWAAAQGKRLSLPKGWALKEEDEEDDDYSPGNRRISAPVRRRRHLNYELNDQEEGFDEDPYRGSPNRIVEQYSERSSIEGDWGVHRPSSISNTRPPSKLINAVKKSLRLPKEQDDLQQSKQIKRRSVGGQGAVTDTGENKRQKHAVDFSSDSEGALHHKRVKTTKGKPRKAFPTKPTNPIDLSQMSKYEPPDPETTTLSPYKQTHTTLRIALIPYPSQSVIHRLRSCMNMATFFSTAIAISGYKGDKDRLFGISATFDYKSDDDADKSMVIREDWQDSFDVFLETVDGAESWTEEGGKCSVQIRLLLSEA